MSGTENLDLPQDGYTEPTMLELLKEKADKLGISYRDNISESTLENKIKAFELAQAKEAEAESEEKEKAPKELTKAEQVYAQRLRSQLMHRVILNTVDPRRSQLKGELVYTGNAQLGFTGKMVPFNLETGYYIPEIILNDLKGRTFTEFYVIKDKDGNEHTKSRQRKAFVIEILESITEEEFAAIRARQQGQGQEE